MQPAPAQGGSILPLALTGNGQGQWDYIDGSREEAFGLSTLHISPQGPARQRQQSKEHIEHIPRVAGARAEIPRNGGLFMLKAPKMLYPMAVGGKRGLQLGFSSASRRRLMRLCMSVDLQETGGLPIFITLTYPKEYPHDNETVKAHLDSFGKRLLRHNPKLSAIWRIELQRRGAPHYHLLVFGTDFIPAAWTARAWYEIVGTGDEKHLAAGTRTEKIKYFGGLVSYAAKYISKKEEEERGIWAGRQWGVINRAALPVNIDRLALSDRAFVQARRIVRRYLKSKGIRLRDRSIWYGATCFIPAELGARICHLVAGLDNAIETETGRHVSRET